MAQSTHQVQRGVPTWVGIDAHLRTFTIAVVRGTAQTPRVHTYPTTPDAVRRVFRRVQREARGPLRVCDEAGPGGFALQRELTALGVACAVIAPALIPRRPGDRIKTDTRDARRLALLSRAGELTPIRIPDAAEEAVRDLVRCRAAAKRDLTRAYHRLGKFLQRQGRVWHGGRNWTQRHWAWVRQQPFTHAAQTITCTELIAAVDTARDRVRRLDGELEAVAAQPPYRAAVGRLRCLHGIDTLSALTVVAELGDGRRFATPRALMGFVGLVPSESSSGARIQRGPITKTGNGHARRILVEAAWHSRHRPQVSRALAARRAGQPPAVVAHAVKAQHRLHARYRRLTHRGKPPAVATVAGARELAAFVWALLVEPAAEERRTRSGEHAGRPRAAGGS